MTTLRNLRERIKGARIYNKHGHYRLYFPASWPASKPIQVKSWLEMVKNVPEVFVRVSSSDENLSADWCKQEAEKIRTHYRVHFKELIHGSELKHNKVQLPVCFRDDVSPIQQGSRSYQKEALTFLCNIKIAALLGDSSTGKTKPAIDLANSRFMAGRIKKVLVFCPASAIKQFEAQIRKWKPDPGLQWKLIGMESMSRSLLRISEAMEYAGKDTMVIVDESHLVKAPHALRSIRIRNICRLCDYKLIITNTPVNESPANVFMQYAMLSDRILGCRSWKTFEKKFLIMGGELNDQVIGFKNLEHLAELIAPYTFYLKKKERRTTPSRQVISQTCSLTEKQTVYYERKKQELLQRLSWQDISAETLFTYLNTLQQIACGFYSDKKQGQVFLGCKKLDLLTGDCVSEPTVIFCKFLFEADMVAHKLGVANCAKFTSQNTNVRDKELRMFTKGVKKYLVTTIGSGGTALKDLSICSTAIFFSRPFKNLREQCIALIDRAGQKKPVRVYDFSTEAGIDSMIMKSTGRKEDLQQQLKTLLVNKSQLTHYVKAL